MKQCRNKGLRHCLIDVLSRFPHSFLGLMQSADLTKLRFLCQLYQGLI